MRYSWCSRLSILLTGAGLMLLPACRTMPAPTPGPSPIVTESPAPMPEPEANAAPAVTPADAERFVAEAEQSLMDLSTDAGRAAWVQSNFITYDTQILAANANEEFNNRALELAKEASRYDGLDLPYDTRRKLELIKRSLIAPPPEDAGESKELSQILANMEAQYGSGKYCPPGKSGDDCNDLEELSNILSDSRDPKKLQEAWREWRTVSPQMRDEYSRFVVLSNEGAHGLGYKDTGALWRNKYDMPPDQFAAEIDRLWTQVKPLYDSLHCYVRARLNRKYGDQVQPLDAPIRADLLGNMWAQEWGNIYDIVAPANADPGYDLTSILKQRKTTPVEMVKYGEGFFTSLGFAPLPDTFWERSLFTKPRDREVVCHASAWDIDQVDDLRIKMCIEPTAEDFQTIHHELGHNFYQRAYNQIPFLYRDSANDGFHEAIGDTIALSVTPAYLVKLGLLKKEPPASKDIGLLLRDALDGIAFLPFGLLVDKWRWGVFSGQITPAEYNKSWWDLRTKYQGIRPPLERTEGDFDPGAKYHVPANVPYTRYFLARILQYQFHRALCQTAGYEGPLNRCTIYGNKAAGEKLEKMLAMGASRPWPEALEALTGQKEMDATAIIDYYAPLKKWLDEQNKNQKCGW